MGALTPAWEALRAHREATRGRTIASLLEEPGRVERFTAEGAGLLLDWSKTHVDERARDLLIALAEAAGVEARRDAMFEGALINETEGRAVLHTALRSPEGSVEVGGRDVMPAVRETLARMEEFAKAVRSGRFAAAGGPVTDVVNIGIGGSDLGPAMAVRALSPYGDGPRCHFVSNVDGADLADALAGLDPARTLVIVASKTFTTTETMTNAETARAWMAEAVPDPGAQFAAVSSATDRTGAFGIDGARVFGFEDWVGGRYSVWGPIGLSLMIAVGPERFREFLAGGAEMDRHFREAPPEGNLPMILALVGLWHHQVCGHPTRAVLPYGQRLARLPAYLQQLEMESNGKGVTMEGALVEASGPVVWGEPGTNGQHAFYQLIHQGTQVVPCEFMLGARGHEPHLAHHHRLLAANCLAQSQALMAGRTMDEARASLGDAFEGAERERQAAHRVFPGDRPSVTILYELLDPATLGRLVALYEHRVFAEGAVLGINSFDQWGVELGKEMAKALDPVLAGDAPSEGDASTRGLTAWLRKRMA